MKLTIEHLAAYLPYEVKVKYTDMVNTKRKAKLTGVTTTEIETTYSRRIKGCSGDIISFNGRNNIIDLKVKLLLRPLSDLTKEIEHNGERFVPIERLFANYGETFIANYTDGSQITLTATYKLMGETYTDFIVCRDSFEFVRYEYVTKLLSWHFDIYSLIPQGLAIPIKPIDNEQQRN